jgi:hypothetical protein
VSLFADVLVWVERVVKLIPVFQDLWRAVEAENTNQQFAAQLEMVRQIREAQARERFGVK